MPMMGSRRPRSKKRSSALLPAVSQYRLIRLGAYEFLTGHFPAENLWPVVRAMPVRDDRGGALACVPLPFASPQPFWGFPGTSRARRSQGDGVQACRRERPFPQEPARLTMSGNGKARPTSTWIRFTRPVAPHEADHGRDVERRARSYQGYEKRRCQPVGQTLNAVEAAELLAPSPSVRRRGPRH